MRRGGHLEMTDSDTGFVDEGVGVPPVEDLPLADAQAVVVCGGPNWKPQDRFLPLEVIRPVQVLTRAGGVACPWFDQYRDYGVSSIKLDPSGEWAVYATSTAVMRIWLHTGQFEDFEVPDLVDVHELTLAGDVLYAANTGRDEVVEMDAVTGKVLMRHSLAPFRSPRARALRSTAIETFHANQAFLDDDGHLMVLAHHAAGFRVLVHARRQLVRHGSGGVLDLTSGVTRDLRLFGPHNVRRHRDGWLINNSGRSEVMLLSTDWEVVGHLDLVGWGTGAAISDDGSILFGGIRATRRRYAKTGDRSETGVEVVALDG
ncbi:MAG TPA: hypothetical protein VK217_03245, partial [Acidimicrobiales bacterium]|nr:hypothetical protein [Acidimicrobiales bacterium]